jgi:hypothetical protein
MTRFSNSTKLMTAVISQIQRDQSPDQIAKPEQDRNATLLAGLGQPEIVT